MFISKNAILKYSVIVSIMSLIYINNISGIDQSNFLKDYGNKEVLKIYWNNFSLIEKEARSFKLSEEQWIEINNIELSKETYWVDNGTIYLNPDIDDIGCLYYNTFHSAFHRSYLHSGKDEMWGEGFCNAFRYFMELKTNNKRSKWMNNLKKYMKIVEDLSRLKKSKDKFLNKYIYPAVLIIYKSDNSYDKFFKLWFELNNDRKIKNADILNNYFNFDPDK